MKIVDGLDYYENVLPTKYAHELFNESLDKFTNGEACWSSNYFWEGPLTKDTLPWFIRDYEGEQKQKILNCLLESNILTQEDIDLDLSVMNYVGTRLSYIPWHNDVPFKCGITIYLNPNWPEEWGGFYLYRESMSDNRISGFIPKFNTALKNTAGNSETGGIFHSVSLVTLGSQCPRVSIQIFPKRIPKKLPQ